MKKAVLALAHLLILGSAACAGHPQISPTSTASFKPLSTPFPSPTNSFTATNTPSPTYLWPQESHLPTMVEATPIPGWERFTSRSLEILLPETYQGGEPNIYVPLIVEILNRGGELQKSIARNYQWLLSEKPDLIRFTAFLQDKQNNLVSTLFVMKVIAPEKKTPDEIVDASIKSVEPFAKEIKKTQVQLNWYDAVQVIIEGDENAGFGGVTIAYYVLEEGSLWTLTYSTRHSDFDSHIEEIEQSAWTFRIIP